jgi:hypothetical protein
VFMVARVWSRVSNSGWSQVVDSLAWQEKYGT